MRLNPPDAFFINGTPNVFACNVPNPYTTGEVFCTVLIQNLIPYERNARVHSEKDLADLMESIREFGFRGRIQVVSPDNPVIVNGHGRVEACKRLGWEEFPDGNIEYVGDLDEEQVKAYRIADNKVAEGSRWNKALYRSEVNSIGKLDMSRFGCDFKSKVLPYGAERFKTDRGYNLDLVSRDDCNVDGMPMLKGIMVKPDGLMGFNYAKSTPGEAKRSQGCHFFIDDYQFERLWTNPKAYLEALLDYQCVLTPDFSLYMDMPLPMQIWNLYRSRAIGHWLQGEGVKVVPTLSWAQPDTYPWAFSGLPKRSTVAVSTVGVKESDESFAAWCDGMGEAIRVLRPRRVLLYGGDVGFDFGRCEVVSYRNAVTERMAARP